MEFKRDIGALGLLFVGISSMMGSGWLFGPLFAAQIAGPGAILSWFIGGILMTMIALTFAELGSAFPVSGGMIKYAQYSHGNLVSFIIGWMVWISSVAVAPVETLGIIQYASSYLPMLSYTQNGVHLLTHIGIVAAALVMLVMVILNYYGAQFFSRSNSMITLVKLFVPITTIFLLLIFGFHKSNFSNPAAGGFLADGMHGIFAALPLGGVIYSFIGSNTILQLAAETKNPQRSIPFALIGSMMLCTLIYVLLQISFVGAVSSKAFAQGWQHLHYQGDSGPFLGIITALGFGWFGLIIYMDALISPFGTGTVYTASTARISYGLSEMNLFPKAIENLNHKGIPFRGLVLNYCVGLLLFLPFPGWQNMISFVISCFIVSYIIGPLSLICLRKSRPDSHRKFKLPYPNLLTLVAFYICNLLIFWTGWHTISRMMIVVAIGLAIYSLFLAKKIQTKFSAEFKNSAWIFLYFILMSAISYFGSFGDGKNILKFGNDFLVIFVMTLGIFYLAFISKQNAEQVAQHF